MGWKGSALFAEHPSGSFYAVRMSKKQRRDLSPDEQHVLEHCRLQLLTHPDELARCDQAILEHHYLHNVTLVGEHLRYALLYQGRRLA